MSPPGPEWYWRRLRRMSAAEMAGRAADEARQRAWRRRQVRPGEADPLMLPSGPRRPPIALAPGTASTVPAEARQALVDAAERLMAGQWEVFGVMRDDLVDPDWFKDPTTGQRAPDERYAFAINHRSETETGNIKQVWELSRHHHLTVLSAAWFLTGQERYAQRVGDHLRSWWRANPNLSGVNWTSGIELAVRLIAWTWTRRLLASWPGVIELFDGNEDAARQIHRHQQYLATFRSRCSSANNHLVAEAAGQFVSTCAFGWFAESDRWRCDAARLLEQALDRNTFPSGVNRELASEYHCFVAELGLVAAVEGAACGHPLSQSTWVRLAGMVDVAAAVADETLAGPRQGDGDEGRALLLDAPPTRPWSSLLVLGGALCGPLPWWPSLPPADVRSTLLTSLAHQAAAAVTPGDAPPSGDPAPSGAPIKARHAMASVAPIHAGDRLRQRSSHFADAGITILRTPPCDEPEIWCRCDGGPHGFLTIAAHAHADALAVEVRVGGVEVLTDPGTYCYHGESEWRSYFRSTIGHNTLELEGRDQSVSGGPFLWVSHAATTVVDVDADGEADAVRRWSAEHDGYRRLDPPAQHRRGVVLDPRRRRLEITDEVVSSGTHRWQLAFHLGPGVAATLAGNVATLRWAPLPASTPAGGGTATLELPSEMAWASHYGEEGPILGWYAAAFGQKQAAVTLVGSGAYRPGDGPLRTALQLSDEPTRPPLEHQALP